MQLKIQNMGVNSDPKMVMANVTNDGDNDSGLEPSTSIEHFMYDNYAYQTSTEELREWRNNSSTLRINEEIVPVKRRITFAWCDINAFVEVSSDTKEKRYLSMFKTQIKPQKHILKNVSGVAYPGELLVLMGSSGAGKTTLMNCMTFRNLKSLKISGLVCINNQPITQTQLAAQSAYVQQDDLFIGCLTVKEHLIFQSLVRMDSHLTYKEKIQRVEEVMEEISLKKCENIQIGLRGVIKGISGGERKRLALAAELLTNPSLLFCDEPTSGLDSFMSLNVVQMLKAMAETGRTVICTLHQPSSDIFQMFDKIGLMAEGRTAFLGTQQEAEEFFSKLQAPCPVNFNPADYYIQLLSTIPGKEEFCKQGIKYICDAFETSVAGIRIKQSTLATKTSIVEDPWSNKISLLSPYKASWWSQFKALSWRNWLSIRKNPRLSRVKFLQICFVSAVVSLVYWNQSYDQTGVNNINGALFLIMSNLTFLNIAGVILGFCCELPLFLREHRNGMYRTDVYFLAKIITDLPLLTAINAFGITVMYYCIGLNPDMRRWLMFILIFLLIIYAVIGLGYLVSTLSSTFQMAQSLVLAIVIPFLIFGGKFLDFRSVPSYLQWLADLSWLKWGNIALMINQWSNIDYIICDNEVLCLKNGTVVLASQDVSVDDFWRSLITLVVLSIAFRILSFCALLYKAYFFE